MSRKIFVNLPVKHLDRTLAFWKALGFSFNPKFTDEKAACMIIGDHAFAMLLTEPFFKTFAKKEICDAATHTEAIVCLSCESRAEVDDLVAKALAAGGKEPAPPQDHGFMYGRSFTDLDHHHWEVMWMDPKAAQ
jgi:hypothetical protein